jgi:YegS/Rv2252/BmrU family lipid kinase
LNPTSGRGEHIAEAKRLATEHEFDVVETTGPGHASELAREAVDDGVDVLGVCGGDGTLHEVVQGLAAVDALDAVTLCLLPAGTENIVAADIGVSSLEEGFEVAERGETRRIDLGMAGDEPFVMSAIAGFPANASAAATHELKQRFGPFAFVVGTVQEGMAFDGIHVDVVADSDSEEVAWTGEALAVLVGNVRGFVDVGGQADAEDGLLDVTIVERMPSRELVAEAIEQRLLHREATHATHFRASGLEVSGLDGDPITYSLDGEIREFGDVRIEAVPGALKLRVGDEYEAHPPGEDI